MNETHPATLHYKRDNCRLCLSKKLQPVMELPPTPCANNFTLESLEKTPAELYFPLDLYLCEDCSHLQLLDVVDAHYLFSNYVYVSGTSAVFRGHFKEYAKELIDLCALQENDLVVDIGSNDGTLLKAFLDCKMQVCGIDPAEKIAQKANEEGIFTLNRMFDEQCVEMIKKTKGIPKLITANNVMAHIDDLRGVVSLVKSLLDPQGVFVFEVSYLADVLEKTLFDTIYHEHLDYHALKPLIPFFQGLGLEIFKAKKVDSHGGSIRIFVAHKGARGISSQIGEFIDLEEKAQLFHPQTYHEFYKKIHALGECLVDHLVELKRSKKIIAGFGAPAKLTTLAHTFQIEKNLIDYVVDDSPLKQHLFTPGKSWPIYSSQHLYDPKTKPDYIVIFAWNFAPSIMKQHPGFTYIIPIPTFKIVKDSHK